jgi:hypothetical protein
VGVVQPVLIDIRCAYNYFVVVNYIAIIRIKKLRQFKLLGQNKMYNDPTES